MGAMQEAGSGAPPEGGADEQKGPESAPAASTAKVKPSPSVSAEELGGFKGLLLQVGMVETVLGLVILGVGGWALSHGSYGRDLNIKLGGSFVGIWIFGGALRWILKRSWKVS